MSPKPLFDPIERVSRWRQLSVGMWGGAHQSPQVLGHREIDLKETLPWLEALRSRSGLRVTITHLWVAALGRVLAKHPELNVILRRNRPYQRRSADVFLQVAVTGASKAATDLSGIKITEADACSVTEVASLVRRKAEKVRSGKDAQIEKAKNSLARIPPMLMPWALRLVSFLSYDLGLDLSSLGVQRDPFGSAMVTNVGGFGIPVGFAPLVPTSRVPMIFLLGEIHERAWAVDGNVEARPTMIVGASFDHRLFDGYQIGYLCTELAHMVEHPDDYDLQPAPS